MVIITKYFLYERFLKNSAQATLLLLPHKGPHFQTQIQAVSVLYSLCFSVISFSSFTFPGALYRIFLLFLPWLPCHFYFVVIEQQQRHLYEYFYLCYLFVSTFLFFYYIILYQKTINIFFLIYIEFFVSCTEI